MSQPVVTTLLALAALPAAARGQCEVGALHAFDAQAGDAFGAFLALAGDVAIVGAPLADASGADSGAAYTFRQAGAGAWMPAVKFTAGDGAPGDRFGFPVATSGKTMAAGALGDDDLGSGAGAVYLFDQVSGVWTETAKLTAPDGAARERFGASLALLKDHVVVGAPKDAPGGSAYVFERTQSGAWFLQQKLVPSDACAGFGYRLAVAGATILVGAPGDDDLGPAPRS